MAGCEEKEVVYTSRIEEPTEKKVKRARKFNHANLEVTQVPVDRKDVDTPFTELERVRLRACLDGNVGVLLSCRGVGWEDCFQAYNYVAVARGCALYAVFGFYRDHRIPVIHVMPRVDLLIETAETLFAPIREMAEIIMDIPRQVLANCQGPSIMKELINAARARPESILFKPQLDDLEKFAASRHPCDMQTFVFSGDYEHDFMYNVPVIEIPSPGDPQAMDDLQECVDERENDHSDFSWVSYSEIRDFYFSRSIDCVSEAIIGYHSAYLSPALLTLAGAYMHVATDLFKDIRLMMTALRRTVEEIVKRIDTIPLNHKAKVRHIIASIHELAVPLRAMPRRDIADRVIQKWLKNPSSFITGPRIGRLRP